MPLRRRRPAGLGRFRPGSRPVRAGRTVGRWLGIRVFDGGSGPSHVAVSDRSPCIAYACPLRRPSGWAMPPLRPVAAHSRATVRLACCPLRTALLSGPTKALWPKRTIIGERCGLLAIPWGGRRRPLASEGASAGTPAAGARRTTSAPTHHVRESYAARGVPRAPRAAAVVLRRSVGSDAPPTSRACPLRQQDSTAGTIPRPTFLPELQADRFRASPRR